MAKTIWKQRKWLRIQKKKKVDSGTVDQDQALIYILQTLNRIFGSNPVAKEVRTPKYKSQVVKSKKIYNRKRNDNR